MFNPKYILNKRLLLFSSVSTIFLFQINENFKMIILYMKFISIDVFKISSTVLFFLSLSGLGTYFNIKYGLRKDAIAVLLQKLIEIRDWFKSQRRFAFYASSLLMIYEGDTESDSYSDFGYDSSASSSKTQSTDNISSTATGSLELTSSPGASSEQLDTDSLTPSVTSVQSVHLNHVDNQSNQSNQSSVNSHHAIADIRMIDFTHVFFVSEQDDNYLYGMNNLIDNIQQLLEMES